MKDFLRTHGYMIGGHEHDGEFEKQLRADFRKDVFLPTENQLGDLGLEARPQETQYSGEGHYYVAQYADPVHGMGIQYVVPMYGFQGDGIAKPYFSLTEFNALFMNSGAAFIVNAMPYGHATLTLNRDREKDVVFAYLQGASRYGSGLADARYYFSPSASIDLQLKKLAQLQEAYGTHAKRMGELPNTLTSPLPYGGLNQPETPVFGVSPNRSGIVIELKNGNTFTLTSAHVSDN